MFNIRRNTPAAVMKAIRREQRSLLKILLATNIVTSPVVTVPQGSSSDMLLKLNITAAVMANIIGKKLRYVAIWTILKVMMEDEGI